jgi:hypothetical protein
VRGSLLLALQLALRLALLLALLCLNGGEVGMRRSDEQFRRLARAPHVKALLKRPAKALLRLY